MLGENAGPNKLEKIESLGIETQEWDDIIEEIKADGEEPAGAADEDDEIDEEEPEEVRQKLFYALGLKITPQVIL